MATPDIDVSGVRTVVTVKSAADQTADANATAIGTWLDSLVTNGEQAVVNWSSLTAAQKDNAAKQSVQAVTRLARLVRNNLSSSGA